MKLLYLRLRDLESLYMDTGIPFDSKWWFDEKGTGISCSRSEVDV